MEERSIEIKPGEFINWIDWDYEKVEPVHMDQLFLPLDDFFCNLELHCQSLCCGKDAFDWKEESVKVAYAKVDKIIVIEALDYLIIELQKHSEEVIAVSIINQLFNRSVLLKLLGHLKNCS